MTIYISLFRGINVGGHNVIKMAEIALFLIQLTGVRCVRKGATCYCGFYIELKGQHTCNEENKKTFVYGMSWLAEKRANQKNRGCFIIKSFSLAV